MGGPLPSTTIPKTLGQQAWDLLGSPFRLLLFDQKWLPYFGWTTLEEERLSAVLPHLRGRLLDIGAGTNSLVNTYGNGVGVDVHDWGGGALVVEDSARLPFADESFDTITCIAALNHVPNREAMLREARRLIMPAGRLVITMINPILGGVGHALWWYSEDKHRGGMEEGEVGGLWPSTVMQLCTRSGFELVMRQRFVYWMNHLFIFEAR